MPAAIAWTQFTDARLLHLRTLGYPWHRVAADLQIGRNAAIERARRLGLPPVNRTQPLPRPAVERSDRPALPPGHPVSWHVLTAGTCLEGEPYPYPVFL